MLVNSQTYNIDKVNQLSCNILDKGGNTVVLSCTTIIFTIIFGDLKF